MTADEFFDRLRELLAPKPHEPASGPAEVPDKPASTPGLSHRLGVRTRLPFFAPRRLRLGSPPVWGAIRGENQTRAFAKLIPAVQCT